MELLRTLAVLAERPGPEHAQLADLLDLPAAPDEATWTQVFVLHLYPYASVYLGGEGKLGGEARDRIAGFFRALDAVPPAEPDHLPTLLAAHAELVERADTGDHRAAHAATTLLHEHLLSWLPLYLGRLQPLAPEPYRSWAKLLAEVLHDQARRYPAPSSDNTTPLPAHLRHAPLVTDPREGADLPLPEQLLVPARTGFLLTGADLRRAARETSLGLRIGERRYVLEQLLAQSVPDTLQWLANHATTTTDDALAGWHTVVPDAVDWWQQRARTTAALLKDLAAEAEEAVISLVP